MPKPRAIRFPYRTRPLERLIQALIQAQLRQRRKIRVSRKSLNRPELPGRFVEACEVELFCEVQAYSAMQNTPENHVPNLVAVLGAYVGIAIAVGLVAVTLYWIFGA